MATADWAASSHWHPTDRLSTPPKPLTPQYRHRLVEPCSNAQATIVMRATTLDPQVIVPLEEMERGYVRLGISRGSLRPAARYDYNPRSSSSERGFAPFDQFYEQQQSQQPQQQQPSPPPPGSPRSLTSRSRPQSERSSRSAGRSVSDGGGGGSPFTARPTTAADAWSNERFELRCAVRESILGCRALLFVWPC